MGFGTAFARRNVMEQYMDKEPFWDPHEKNPQYSLLNQVQVPTEETIRQYQIQKIQTFEKAAMKKQFANLDPLAKQNFQNIISNFSSDENQVINEMITNFVTKVNALYYVGNLEEKNEQQWKDIQKRFQRLEQALNVLMKELNTSSTNSFGMPTVLGTTLLSIQQAMSACNIENLDVGYLNGFLKNLNKLKGDALEEIGVAFFKKLRVPAIESIRLGSVYLHTKQANRHSGQLIQDLIAYNINSPEILNDVEVEYKPIGASTPIKAPLSQLLKDIEAANGQSKNIIIYDSTYDILTNLQSINVQAKSGKNQLPWNKNASTSVAIGEYGKDNLALSVKNTFKLLHTLNSAENNEQPWRVKDSSEDYNALANYGLATVMNKVLHLSSKEGNQFVLTPFGFMTFSERMTQLLKTENYIALIQGGVTLNNNTLGTKYQVGITK